MAFPPISSRHTMNASPSQNLGTSATFTNPDFPPPYASPHTGHISSNDHQHKKRRLSPPIAHATGSASMGQAVGGYHSRGSGVDSDPQGHPEHNEPREVVGNTDTEMMVGLGEDEIQGRRASPAQGLPRRSSGSSPAAVARHPSVNARAPPSMSTSILTSSASTQAAAAATSTEQSGAGANKQWKTPTGHRRGITVKEMLPLDAPTQPRRRSVTTNGGGSRPTSSSGVPYPQSPPAPPSMLGTEEQIHGTLRVVKRPLTSSSAAESISPAHSSALSLDLDLEVPDYDSPDVLGMPTTRPMMHSTHPTQPVPLPMQRNTVTTGTSDSPAMDPSLVEDPVALKRRQNTIAARRSRQRKLEHVRSLEKQVDGLTRERDELRSRVARLEDRVAFLKEIVAGNGGSSGAVATSPRTTSRATRQLSGKRAAPTQWEDNDADELYDDDTGRRGDDEEYDDEY